jgi:hypothetical protein
MIFLFSCLSLFTLWFSQQIFILHTLTLSQPLFELVTFFESGMDVVHWFLQHPVQAVSTQEVS